MVDESKFTRAFISNIPFQVSCNDVAQVARTFGSVRKVYLAEKRPAKGNQLALHAGYGFVEFRSIEAAKKFVEACASCSVVMEGNRYLRAAPAKKHRIRKSKSNRLMTKNKSELSAQKITEGENNVPMHSAISLLEQLPTDLWHRLFAYLDLKTLFKLKFVSRTMHGIVCRIISGLTSLDLSSPPLVLYGCNENSFASRYIYVDRFLLNRIFSHCNAWSSLRRLNLNSEKVRITPESINVISSQVRSLEDLSIACHGVTNGCFKRLFARNVKLRVFSLSAHSGKVTLKFLRSLYRSCPGLTHLSFDVSKAMFSIGLDVSVSSENASQLATSFFCRKPASLRFVKLSAHSDFVSELETILCALNSDTIVTAHLSCLPKVSMPNLRQIVLPNLPVNGSNAIWKLLPRLESLKVSPSESRIRPSDADLSFFASSECPVSEIALPKCSIRDSDLPYFSRMKAIDLRDNCELGDDDIKTFINGNVSIERLGLRGFCNITSDLIRFLAVMCTRLELLNLADCPNVDNSAIESILSARSERRHSCVPLSIVTPGTKIVLDNSFPARLLDHGIAVHSNWTDITRIAVVKHLEPMVIANVEQEDWPLSARRCNHRGDIDMLQLLGGDNFDPLLAMLEDMDDLDDMDDMDDDDGEFMSDNDLDDVESFNSEDDFE